MDPTDLLKHEHRVIEKVLSSLVKSTDRLISGESVRPGFFSDAAEFFREFADGCHHRKEEDILFEQLIPKGLSKEQGPVAVMLAQHEEGRRLTREMADGAERWAAGDQTARDTVIRAAREYVTLLREHIDREDHVLFPMAARLLDPGELTEISEAFERVERDETGEGVHEKYAALADKLEAEARGT